MTSDEQPSAKSARTRQRLLDATARVIARKGFSGTRLSDIGEIAEVQAPAIYYYYSSREELIEEVMFTGATAMLEHLDGTLAALPSDASITDRLAAAVEAHLRVELDISDYSRAIIRSANQLPESVSGRALRVVAEYNNRWRSLIADLAAAGDLRPGLDDRAARMLVLGSLNWAAEWFNDQAGPIEKVIETAQAMVVHALVADDHSA